MDDADWEPIEVAPQQRPAPSGFTTNSHAANRFNALPAISSGRPPLRVPPLTVTRGRRASGAGLLTSPDASDSKRWSASETVAIAKVPVARGPIVQPQRQPQPPPPHKRQQLPTARHRTMLNYALDVFASRLESWTLGAFALDPDGQTSGGGIVRRKRTCRNVQDALQPLVPTAPTAAGCTAAYAAPESAHPATALSADVLEQLESILFALQTSLRDGCAEITGQDREDLWQLCSTCWEAATAAARVACTVAGAAEQSRTLQRMGGTLYDLANEQPLLAVPGGRSAGVRGVGAGPGGGCSLGALFARVKLFHRMGRMWLATGNLDQAGWHLAHAREGLGQLQAEEPAGVTLTCSSAAAAAVNNGQRPAKRPRQETAQDLGLEHKEEHAEALEEVAEGGGGGGGGSGGCGGRGGGLVGPWLALGVSASTYLGVEAGVLLESLRLALAEGHKALSANLQTQLRRLSRLHNTPPDLAAAATLATAAALTDAAAAKLQLALRACGVDELVDAKPAITAAAAPKTGGAAPAPDRRRSIAPGAAEAHGGGAGGQSLQSQAQAQQQEQRRQEAVTREGLDLLIAARALLEEALEEARQRRPHRRGKGQGQAVHDGDWGGAAASDDDEADGGQDWCPTDVQLAAMADLRQQIVKLLISGSLRAGDFQAALDYSRQYAEPPAPAGDEAAEPAGKHRDQHGQGRGHEAPPMDVLLLGLQAYVGLGRVAEAAAVVARDIQPHAACTPSVIKAALSKLLDAPLPQLSAAMPHITACLLACLARCGPDDETGGAGGGAGYAAPGEAAWLASAGAELVLLVAAALASHEGPAAERDLLGLLAHDDAVAAICHSDGPRDRLHRLLYARAAAAYQQGDHAAAARLFAAALLYASGGGGAPYCRTARMLSNCYAAMGQARRALGYLDLAETHEPDTVAHLLLRLRLVLMMQGGEGKGGSGGGGAEGEADETVPAAAAEAAAAPRDDEEAVCLVERLPRCCDFEASHLSVAHDIALRARRFAVALAATQLAMRDLAARRPAPATPAAASTLHAAIALARSSVAARLESAGHGGGSGGAGVRGSGSCNGPLPCEARQGVLQDLRWLCSLMKAAGGPTQLPAQSQATLSWLRDVSLRLCYDVLGACEDTDGDASANPSGWRCHISNTNTTTTTGCGSSRTGSPERCRFSNQLQQELHSEKQGRELRGGGGGGRGGWRMAAAALGVARQLDGQPRAPGMKASGAAAAGGAKSCAGPRTAKALPLQPALLAVAAHMLAAYARGEAGGKALLESAERLLHDPHLQDSLQPQTRAQPAPQRGVRQGPAPRAGPARQQQTSTPGPAEEEALRGSVLQLRFALATFQRDEQRQKAVLQDPAVGAAQLEALAELCLEPGSPWRCAAMACGLLGFALRKALAAGATPGTAARREAGAAEQRGVHGTDAGIGIVARAIRRLFLLGSADVRLRVCERAAEVAAQMRQRLAGPAAPTSQAGATAGPAVDKAAAPCGPSDGAAQAVACPYPDAELHYLWAACFNGAVADALSAAGDDAALASGRAQRLLAMATRLAGLSDGGDGIEAGGPAASGQPDAGAADVGVFGAKSLTGLVLQTYGATLETLGAQTTSALVVSQQQEHRQASHQARPAGTPPRVPARLDSVPQPSQQQLPTTRPAPHLPTASSLPRPPQASPPPQAPPAPLLPSASPPAAATEARIGVAAGTTLATTGAASEAPADAVAPPAAQQRHSDGPQTAAVSAQPLPPNPPLPPQCRSSPAVPAPAAAGSPSVALMEGHNRPVQGRHPAIWQRQRAATPRACAATPSSQPQRPLRPPEPSKVPMTDSTTIDSSSHAKLGTAGVTPATTSPAAVASASEEQAAAAAQDDTATTTGGDACQAQPTCPQAKAEKASGNGNVGSAASPAGKALQAASSSPRRPPLSPGRLAADGLAGAGRCIAAPNGEEHNDAGDVGADCEETDDGDDRLPSDYGGQRDPALYGAGTKGDANEAGDASESAPFKGAEQAYYSQSMPASAGGGERGQSVCGTQALVAGVREPAVAVAEEREQGAVGERQPMALVAEAQETQQRPDELEVHATAADGQGEGRQAVNVAAPPGYMAQVETAPNPIRPSSQHVSQALAEAAPADRVGTESDETQPPDYSQPLCGTQPPSDTQPPDGTQRPGWTQPLDGTQVPHGTQLPDGTQGPDGSQLPHVAQPPIGTQAPEGTQPPEPGAFEAAGGEVVTRPAVECGLPVGDGAGDGLSSGDMGAPLAEHSSAPPHSSRLAAMHLPTSPQGLHQDGGDHAVQAVGCPLMAAADRCCSLQAADAEAPDAAPSSTRHALSNAGRQAAVGRHRTAPLQGQEACSGGLVCDLQGRTGTAAGGASPWRQQEGDLRRSSSEQIGPLSQPQDRRPQECCGGGTAVRVPDDVEGTCNAGAVSDGRAHVTNAGVSPSPEEMQTCQGWSGRMRGSPSAAAPHAAQRSQYPGLEGLTTGVGASVAEPAPPLCTGAAESASGSEGAAEALPERAGGMHAPSWLLAVAARDVPVGPPSNQAASIAGGAPSLVVATAPRSVGPPLPAAGASKLGTEELKRASGDAEYAESNSGDQLPAKRARTSSSSLTPGSAIHLAGSSAEGGPTPEPQLNEGRQGGSSDAGRLAGLELAEAMVAEPAAAEVVVAEATAADPTVAMAILAGSEYADEVDALMLDDW